MTWRQAGLHAHFSDSKQRISRYLLMFDWLFEFFPFYSMWLWIVWCLSRTVGWRAQSWVNILSPCFVISCMVYSGWHFYLAASTRWSFFSVIMQGGNYQGIFVHILSPCFVISWSIQVGLFGSFCARLPWATLAYGKKNIVDQGSTLVQKFFLRYTVWKLSRKTDV